MLRGHRISFALSFASTVFAVQALERASESQSLAGRLSIGVLVLQDLFAVAFLVLAGDGWPSPWAIVVVPAFLLLRPIGGWFLDRSGYGEILVLLNSCPHRGMKVCRHDHGSAPVFTCPYHGWTYDLHGRLIGVPRAGAYPGLQGGQKISERYQGVRHTFCQLDFLDRGLPFHKC